MTKKKMLKIALVALVVTGVCCGLSTCATWMLTPSESLTPVRATALIATVEVQETATAEASQRIATTQAQATATAQVAQAQAAIGTSRSNPVPMGHVAAGGGMNLVVTEVRRPANDEVQAGNMYNDSPEPGNEYVMVYVMAECTLSPEEDEQCNLEPYEFELTGSSNLVREHAWVSGVQGVLQDTEFYSGGTVAGALVFQVAQGEDNLILIYEPFWSFLFENEVFFALQ